MVFTVSVLVILYLFVIFRAVQFFTLPGTARDDDKTVAAVIIAASVMFIVARVTTFVNHPAAIESAGSSIALWVGFGLFNAMLYLGLLHRMSSCRMSKGQRRLQPVDSKPDYRTAA